MKRKNIKEQEILLWKKKRKILKFGMLKQNYLIFAFIGCTFWVKVELPCFYQILPWLFPQTILFIIVFKIKEYKTGLFYCYVMYECSNSLFPQNLTPTTPSTAPIWKKTVSQLLYITIDLKQHHESSRIIIHGLSTS